ERADAQGPGREVPRQVSRRGTRRDAGALFEGSRSRLPDRVGHPGDAHRRSAAGVGGALSDRILFGLLVLFALLTSQISAAYAVFGLLAVGWFAVRLREGALAKRLRSPVSAIAAAYAFFVTLSAVFSTDPRRSIAHLPGLTLLLLLPMTMDVSDSIPRGRTLALALGGAQCAMSLFALWQYVHDRGSDIGERIEGTLSHYMTFSGLAMLGGCVLIAFLFEEKGR